MPGIRARQVLLIGSVPLDSSSAVFEAVASSLGLSYEERWRAVWPYSEAVLGRTRRRF